MGGVFKEANRVHCGGENALAALSGVNTAFWQDLNAAREQVASGLVDVTTAVAFVLEGGPLVQSQQDQMTACLKKIEAGQCPIYNAAPDTTIDR